MNLSRMAAYLLINSFFLPNLAAGEVALRPAHVDDDRNDQKTCLPPPPDFKSPVDYKAWYINRNFPPGAPLGDKLYSSLNAMGKPDKIIFRQLATAAGGPWVKSDFPELAKYIGSVNGQLRSLQEATKEPVVRWDLSIVDQSGFFTIPKPENWTFRHYCKIILAKSWCIENDEQTPVPELFLDTWEACLNCANHLEKRFGATTCLMAIGIRGYVYLSVHKALSLGILDETNIMRVQELVKSKTKRPAIDEACRFELMFLHDLLQRIYPDGKFSDAAVKKLGQSEYLPSHGIFLSSPKTTAARAGEYYGSLIAIASRELSLAGRGEIMKLERERESIKKKDFILSLYMPSLLRTYELAIYDETMRRGTILALAIGHFQKREGRWPAAFSELNDADLISIRKDPYSGCDFVYKLNSGEPILYSVGYDGKDNGGIHDKRAHSKPGYDIVIFPCQ